MQQPALVDDWGVPFNGKAKTVTGDVWWYEQDGKRYPLKPIEVVTIRDHGCIVTC